MWHVLLQKQRAVTQSVWFWAALFVGLNAVDAALTHHLLSRGGIEANPVISLISDSVALYFKGFALLPVVFVLCWMARKLGGDIASMKNVMVLGSVLYAFICIWNAIMLFRI